MFYFGYIANQMYFINIFLNIKFLPHGKHQSDNRKQLEN